jgi:hypothetical protein
MFAKEGGLPVASTVAFAVCASNWA